MMKMFFELIQVALGTRSILSRNPSEDDWQQIYDTAAKHSLVGVIFSAIEYIYKQDCTIKPPKMMFYKWLGEVQMIETHNKRLNEAAEHLTRIFKNGRLRNCVLKGQGIATLYPQSLRRQSGDIDIWVEGGREKVLQFLKDNFFGLGYTVIHHVDTRIIEGIETEVHFFPSYSYDYFRYLKYKSFFKEEANQQFNHFDGNVGFAYPTNKFNAVYLMMHISRHIFQEGIGLRQLMDYYFVLIHLLDQEREWAYGKLKWLGLRKLTSAVMYVMKTVFQMDDKYLLCKPSEKIGVYLLEDVFQGGNLGRFGEQYKASYSDNDNDIILYLKNLKRLRKVYSLCPSEVFWAPVWKPFHWIWRKWNGYL